MLKEVIAIGKDVNEAKENARVALGAGPLDDVNFEILHMGSRGIFGIIGVKNAQVKASMEVPDAPHEKRGEKPRHEKKKNKKPEARREEKKNEPKEKKPREEKKSEPKEAIIPEAEMKMERREVSIGEDMSFDFINTLIADIGLDATAELYACEDGSRRITLTGEDASILIGHHGDTLDALQYLANLASARKNIKGERDKSRVTIDIGGYRAKREETLRALARRMAAKALRNRRSVMLEPMSAYERRIIHSEVQGIEGVSTNSVGSDNNRKIVIYLTDKKPKGIFEDDEVKTSLKEEFATEEDDVTASVGAVDGIVGSDLEADKDSETVVVVTTHPADDEADSGIDEDIK